MSSNESAGSVAMPRNDVAAGVAHVLAEMEAKGVSAVQVADGEVVAATKKTIEGWLKTIDESGQDHIIIFIKHGGEISEN